MTNFEDEIRKSLLSGASEEELQELSKEKSYFEEIGELFKGRNRWLTIGAYIEAFIFLGIFIYAVFGLLETDSDKMRSIYLLIAILSLLVAALIKLWLWIQMNRNVTVREILRLELRILDIQKKLEK